MKKKNKFVLLFITIELLLVLVLAFWGYNYSFGVIGGVCASLISVKALLLATALDKDYFYRRRIVINRLLRFAIYLFFLIPAFFFWKHYHYIGVISGLISSKWLTNIYIINFYSVT